MLQTFIHRLVFGPLTCRRYERLNPKSLPHGAHKTIKTYNALTQCFQTSSPGKSMYHKWAILFPYATQLKYDQQKGNIYIIILFETYSQNNN